MKKILLIILLVSTNSFAWRVDYSLALPGTPPTGVDYVNYLIWSKDLINEQNEKLRPIRNNGPLITHFVGSGN